MSTEIEVASQISKLKAEGYTTFAEDILRAAADETILSIAIGQFGWGGFRGDEQLYPNGKPPEDPPIGEPIFWSAAKPHLDYYYDGGYGSPSCHAIYAWTDSKVIFVSQYDGATGLETIPRNPSPCDVVMPGG